MIHSTDIDKPMEYTAANWMYQKLTDPINKMRQRRTPPYQESSDDTTNDYNAVNDYVVNTIVDKITNPMTIAGPTREQMDDQTENRPRGQAERQRKKSREERTFTAADELTDRLTGELPEIEEESATTEEESSEMPKINLPVLPNYEASEIADTEASRDIADEIEQEQEINIRSIAEKIEQRDSSVVTEPEVRVVDEDGKVEEEVNTETENRRAGPTGEHILASTDEPAQQIIDRFRSDVDQVSDVMEGAFRIAGEQIGMTEGEQNEAIQDFLRTGGQNLNPKELNWCTAYVNASLGHAGMEGTDSLVARSFLNWGEEVTEPERGDIVVLSRGDPNGWQGHVGFFDGYGPDGKIRILGGNQKKGINLSHYDADKLLGFRRAKTQPNKLANEITQEIDNN